jgi:type IV pilus assembly protein PilM
VLDYHSLGVVETSGGQRTRVVAVAAPREMVTKLLEALRAAGLRPEGIDLSAFAMIRALHKPDAGDGSLTLYVNVGGLTNIALARGTMCVFTRIAAVGIESVQRDLEAGARRVADEARNSIEFHAMQEPGAAVGRVSLSGRAAALPGFAEAFGAALGMDIAVEVGSVAEAHTGALSAASGPAVAIAAGLAVEEHVA